MTQSEVTLIDYGLGNISAFHNIFSQLNTPVAIACKAEDVLGAKRLILPGVGAFDWAMGKLSNSGMKDSLNEAVLSKKTPVLGICVGMQIMANSSEEGTSNGLGWLDAEVRRFTPNKNSDANLPHMGWNDLETRRTCKLLDGLESPNFYYLHSYHFVARNEESIVATTNYFQSFASIVSLDNIYGVQFHPEKSHGSGIKLLDNFSRI